MDREPIPILTAPVSILAFLVVGTLWSLDKIDKYNELLGSQEFYISLGAIVILATPIISQILFAIWQKFIGFWTIDYSRELYSSTKLLCNFCEHLYYGDIIQNCFDKNWHGQEEVEITCETKTKKICASLTEYSRRRMNAARLSSMSIMTIILGLLIALSYILSERVYINITHLFVFLAAVAVATIIFRWHLRRNSSELYKIQKPFFNQNEDKINKEIENEKNSRDNQK